MIRDIVRCVNPFLLNISSSIRYLGGMESVDDLFEWLETFSQGHIRFK